MVLIGLPLVPLTLPVLPPATLQAYMARLGLGVSSAERHEMGALPQHFADMFGWESLADAVARVVRMLPPDERRSARIYAQNYGEAGSLEYYGPSRGLPPVISGHNAYWHWGPGPEKPGGVLVIVGGDEEDHRRALTDVREAGRTTCTLCMPYEQDLPIFVARGLRRIPEAAAAGEGLRLGRGAAAVVHRPADGDTLPPNIGGPPHRQGRLGLRRARTLHRVHRGGQ